MRGKKQYAEKSFAKQSLINKNFAVEGKHDLILVLDNLKPNFNIGKLFRTAEFFSIKSIFLCGIDYFNPSPSKGTFPRVKADFFKDFESCYNQLKKMDYNIYAFESQGASPMHSIQFPKKSAFILGHEEFGISFDLNNFPDIKSIKINSFGESESLNVAIAGSISIYEYVRQQN